MRVLVDKSLITIHSDMSLQMHDLIKALAREIIHEESIMSGKQRRLWNSSEAYNALSEKKVAITEAVEVLFILLEKFSQKVHIDANDFAHMKKLRILKIYQEEEVSEQKLESKGHNVIFLGSLYFLSNELRLFCWHGCPFKYLPSDFYPENIVAIDLSYSNIINFWTTPKCFRRLKVMKLKYCRNLTTTPDFSEITNLEELDLEGCVNLVSVHPSIGMLKRLVVLNLAGCLKVNQHPSFVSALINLQSLSFSGQGRIQPRWWTSITAPFGLLSKQQHPQRSIPSLAGLHMLKDLNLSYCNLEQVPESIGGLSCLECLDLEGNNFTSLPVSLSQLSHLRYLRLHGCKKLEVLPELSHTLYYLNASDCTSLREVTESSKDPFRKRLNAFRNCPKLFKNVTVDSEGSISSKTQCLDSSITTQGSIHQLSAFLGYLGFQKTNRCEFFSEFFSQDTVFYQLDIGYHGNSMPEWFTNRSMGNDLKVELPSDWCYDKFIGFGTCVVFKCTLTSVGYAVKNFDGAFLNSSVYIPDVIKDYFEKEVIGIQDSYMIWLHYYRKDEWHIRKWEEAKNFVTFCLKENNKDFVEVKEFGARLICDGDLQQQDVTHLSMFQDITTQSQHGGVLSFDLPFGNIEWSW